ncbi:hypothetical protein [Corynebacterium bovis]|uniref:hypothetical protein n=1 Tax=Corynebacterium bovis TaxID=36808 RepID=UPI00163B22C0|nr:hypothetical protein [Corynebacterium bovis]
MTRHHLTGTLWMLSGLAVLAGQLTAVIRWRGMYSMTDNLIGDLGASGCGLVRDAYGPRYICSPGAGWFTGLTATAGILLALGAVVLLTWPDGGGEGSGDGAGRDGRDGSDGAGSDRSDGGDGRGAVPVAGRGGGLRRRAVVAVPLILAGCGMTVTGLAPSDAAPGLHDAATLWQGVWVWLAMIGGLTATRAARRDGGHGVLHGGYAPLTCLLLGVSVAGGLGFLALGTRGMPGMFERAWLDLGTVWIIVVGLAAVTLGGAGEREEIRRARIARDQVLRAERDRLVREAAARVEGGAPGSGTVTGAGTGTGTVTGTDAGTDAGTGTDAEGWGR